MVFKHFLSPTTIISKFEWFQLRIVFVGKVTKEKLKVLSGCIEED